MSRALSRAPTNTIWAPSKSSRRGYRVYEDPAGLLRHLDEVGVR
jgi:hypothetical protein